MEGELVRVATELARQATQLQEMELAIRSLNQLMNQADQRGRDVLARDVHGRPSGQEDGVLGRGREVRDH